MKPDTVRLNAASSGCTSPQSGNSARASRAFRKPHEAGRCVAVPVLQARVSTWKCRPATRRMGRPTNRREISSHSQAPHDTGPGCSHYHGLIRSHPPVAGGRSGHPPSWLAGSWLHGYWCSKPALRRCHSDTPGSGGAGPAPCHT